MTKYTFRSSLPNTWVLPRASAGTDADRMRTYGPIQPMDRPEDELPAWAGILLVIALFGLLVFGSVAVSDAPNPSSNPNQDQPQ